MKKYLLFITLATLAIGAIAQENFDTVKIRTQKVAESIYMLEGSGGNIGVLTGPDGVLMVDDQFAPLSAKIKEAIKKLDPGTVKFLINTHVHGDHAGGNINFKRDGATIFAHDQVRVRLMTEPEDEEKKGPPINKDAWPLVTFAEKISLHVNGQDVDLIHFTKGHTDGDVLIHFVQANVFHAGDLYVRYGYPFIDTGRGGGINGFITNLDKMLLLMNDNSKIIPGHGALASKNDVKIFRDKMVDIRDQVAAAIKKGKKTEDIPALGITTKYDVEWGKGFLSGKDFVLMVAESLKQTPKR